MENNEFGVIYVATGKAYTDEAINSARTCKNVMPDVSILLWTDQPINNPGNLFAGINKLRNVSHSFIDKIEPLCNTPFKKNLFVDTDVKFLEPVYDIISLLERFEFAFCHAPWRICPGRNNILDDVPESFPEPNSGVLAYRADEMVLQMIKEWKKIYTRKLNSSKIPTNDQSSLRQALWNSSLNTTVLPSEYNIRTPFPLFAGGNSKVKILHGRDPELSRALNKVNISTGIRIFDFYKPTTFLSLIKFKCRKVIQILKD